MSEKVSNFIDDYLGLQISSTALLSLAIIPIIIGSFSSLNHYQGSNKQVTRRSTRSKTYAEEDEIDNFFKPKIIALKDTLLLPIIISGFVYFLSCITQIVHPSILNSSIALFTAFFFTVVFSSTIIIVLKHQLPSLFKEIETYHFSFNNQYERLCHLDVTLVHLVIYLISIALSIFYIVTQHWIVENIFAISIAIHSIRFLTLRSFGTGFLLLLGMLAYDVFWVFGTNTLVNLSKDLVHAPGSVVWPRNINTYVLNQLVRKDQYFTMFGLGEIIVPGIFIAYCLKVDQSNGLRKSNGKSSLGFSKAYFLPNFLAYTVGAAFSIYTVLFTKKSQSAFLFIVPALILTTCAIATSRNELNLIYDGSDILNTFREISGFTEEERPTFEERLQTPSRRGRSRSTSKSSSRRKSSFSSLAGDTLDDVKEAASNAAETTEGVVTEAFVETKRIVGPYVEEAVETTKKVVEPYIEEAVKTTRKAINSVATKVQEQTTIEEDVVAEHRAKRRGRSKSVTRKPRSTSKSTKRKA